ncbi:NAD(P)/FAD-dependent oxidoreductase [Spongisporangium articulatum]|uniref:NAD(P)/FAD-dependent oxidoreductase n=1 Tax=Spongisporangium articulatum TaxID=3362603 RepID=A0ABW8ASE2_9ACTN
MSTDGAADTAGAVVVGASIAGVRTVQALRRAGYTGPVHLVGAEPHLPYDKPPLSKAVLAADIPDPVPLLTQEQAEELDVVLHLGVPAEDLDTRGRRVLLADGRALPYDHVVIATGAHARPSPWTPDSGLHVLRTLDDCRALHADLRTALATGGSVVVVGAGFIGAEVASTCRALGLEVTLVDPVAVPMARALGGVAGREMVELHHRHGAHTRFGVGVLDVSGRVGDLTVHLDDGSRLACATVVVGIGADPQTDWLLSSDVITDNGVVCDETGRTSVPDVYALGDVATWRVPGEARHRRLEHWTNAVDQSLVVALAIAQPEVPRSHRPNDFVWSDQYDWKLHVVGRPALGERTVTVHNPDRGAGDVDRFAVLTEEGDDGLAGAVVVNWPGASVQVRRALAGGAGFEAVTERVRGLVSSRG